MNIKELKEAIKDLPDELRVTAIDHEVGIVDVIVRYEKHFDVNWGLDKFIIELFS